MPTPLITRITSTSNQQIKQWMKLHTRKGRLQQGLLLVEGDHLIQEAKQAGLLMALIKEEHQTYDCEVAQVYLVSRAICDKLSKTDSKGELFGIVKMPQFSMEGTRFLYCEALQDPGNLGTLIRSAKSFGYDGVLVSDHSVDVFNDKVTRSSQGANLTMPTYSLPIDQVALFCTQRGLTLVGTDVNQAQSTKVLPKDRIMIVLGNEGSGMSEFLHQQSDLIVKIETVEFESLNVAIAGSILMYLTRKQPVEL